VFTRLYLGYEDAVGAGGCVMLGSLRDHTICIANEQKIECIFFRTGLVFAQVAQVDVVVLVRKRLDSREVFKAVALVAFVQKILTNIVVNFHLADGTLEAALSVFAETFEELGERTGDESAIGLSFRPSSDREGLA